MSLPKSQRLKSKISIDQLFTNRKSHWSKNLKLYYNYIDKPIGEKSFLFTSVVPKKLIKIAVKRNLIKRKIRESFRANKDILTLKIPDNKQIHLLFVYNKKDILDYKSIEKDVLILLHKL